MKKKVTVNEIKECIVNSINEELNNYNNLRKFWAESQLL